MRFLLRPRWLLSHVLVLALVVVMINLGFWQLRRLDEKRARNDLIEAASDQPPVDPRALVRDLDAARFRPVIATGRYEGAPTLVLNRTEGGLAGSWVVETLVLEDGSRVPVSRGFLITDRAVPEAPRGSVAVQGYAVPRERLDRTARIDLEHVFDETGVLPLLVQTTRSSPVDDPALTAVERPELGEGPHLSYAVQWFIFSTIAVIGYPLVLRRVVRRRGHEVDDVREDELDRELAELLRDER